jgi:hypothetical protein
MTAEHRTELESGATRSRDEDGVLGARVDEKSVAPSTYSKI